MSNTLTNILKTVANNYLTEKQKSFKNNELAYKIRKTFPDDISSLLSLDNNKFIAVGSAGKGNWTSRPWFAVLHKSLCRGKQKASAEQGYYPVLTFSYNFKECGIALGQGEHSVREQYKNKTFDILKSRAIILANKVPEYKKNFIESPVMKLNKETASTHLKKVGERWMASCAFGKIYKLDKLPPENIIIQDLQELMRLYEISIERGGTSEPNIVDSTNISSSDETLEKIIIQHIDNEKAVIRTDQKFINTLKKEKDYTCEACGLNFKNIYGDCNKSNSYIEAHHLKTKKSATKKFKMGGERRLTKEDFAILCANCHRMIHRVMSSNKDKHISLDTFKKLISKKYISAIKRLT
jgi:5-methylcytosine-specific restriction enzyme A